MPWRSRSRRSNRPCRRPSATGPNRPPRSPPSAAWNQTRPKTTQPRSPTSPTWPPWASSRSRSPRTPAATAARWPTWPPPSSSSSSRSSPAMSTLATERVAIGTAQDEGVQTLLAAGGANHPFFSERTGVHVATSLSIAALGERRAHPAIRKLIGTGHRQAVAETVLELLGPAGAVEGEASGEFLLTRCLSIAGGTTQILLNQVGERVLGLLR